MIPRLELDRTETPTDVNPLGIKGVGEAGTIGAFGAVPNAVGDALAPLGIELSCLPHTPERIFTATQRSRSVLG
jgi:carbon-monoxide dehydrogenase large subunit